MSALYNATFHQVTQKQIIACFAMAVCGALLGLSAPGYNAWWLAWFSLAPAFLINQTRTSRLTQLVGGFLFGFLFQGIYCLWFFDLHPLTWLGFTDWASRFTTLAGWLLIASEGGLLTAIFFYLVPIVPSGLWRYLALPVLWLMLFSLLNLTPLALPWGLLEYTQASVPILRSLSHLTGSWGITGLLLVYNLALATVFSRVLITKKPDQNRFSGFIALLIFSSLPFGVATWGISRNLPGKGDGPNRALVIVQANLPIEWIRSGNLSPALVEKAYLQPVKNLQLPPNSLVVFPEEGVVPDVVALSDPESNGGIQQLQTLAQHKKSSIAVGVATQDDHQHFYNTVAIIPSDPRHKIQFYHKRRLVPFGEYTPYGLAEPLLSILHTFQINYNAPFSIGQSSKVLQVGNLKIGALMCFELIDPNFAATYKASGAQLLINLSNLGWFHQNPLIEAQFLAIGQLRAAEAGIPLVIASNTGISAVISSTGKTLRQTVPAPRQNMNTTALNQSFTQTIFYTP